MTVHGKPASRGDGFRSWTRHRRAPLAVSFASVVLSVAFLAASAVHAQSLDVSFFAGATDGQGHVDGDLSAARYGAIFDLCVDPFGSVFVRDVGTIRKISGGVVTTMAGLAGHLGTAGGPSATARLSGSLGGCAVWADGTLFVLDLNVIRRVEADGTITTVAGNPLRTFRDGRATGSAFQNAGAIRADRAGHFLVADANAVRRFDPVSGDVVTIAGAVDSAGAVDGPAATARFNSVGDVAALASGDILVADTANHAIRKISPDGSVLTWAGLLGALGQNDGYLTAARFSGPQSLGVDAMGRVWVLDGNRVRRIDSSGYVATIAEIQNHSILSDIAVGPAGNLLVPSWDATISEITPAGAVTTISGRYSEYGFVQGQGAVARFDYPRSIVRHGDGNLYVNEFVNQSIRRVTTAGYVAAFLGSPTSTYPGVTGFLSADPGGFMWATSWSYITRVDSLGNTLLACGAINQNGTVDGFGTAARFYGIGGIAADASGNKYVSDTFNHTIRRIDPSLYVATIAGMAGQLGSLDGVGSTARFQYPGPIAVDGTGNIYVGDSNGIRRLAPDLTVTTVVPLSYAGANDGALSEATVGFGSVTALYADSSGDLYFADGGLVRKVSGGFVSTVAGNPKGMSGPLTMGRGALARFYRIGGIVRGWDGAFYITDSEGNAVRRATGGTCALSAVTSVPKTALTGSMVTLTANPLTSGCVGTLEYHWDIDGYLGNVHHATTASTTYIPTLPGRYKWQLLATTTDGGVTVKSGILDVPPSNDACSAANVISTDSFSDEIWTTSATTDAGDPAFNCAASPALKTVWYRFTAPADGNVEISTAESSYDTIVGAFSGSCGALVPVPSSCNDNAGMNSFSDAVFPVSTGMTYWIAVGGKDDYDSLLRVSFTFDRTNPFPAVTAISPLARTAGMGAFSLTVDGAGFIPASVVYWNSTALVTHYVSPNRLTADVPGSFVENPTTASVYVLSPSPGGGASSGFSFTVAPTPLAVTLFDPACAPNGLCNGDLISSSAGYPLNSDSERLLTLGRPVEGAVCDGVTRLLLVVRTDTAVTVSLVDEQGNAAGVASGQLAKIDGTGWAGSVTVSPVATTLGNYAFLSYLAPADLPSSSSSAFESQAYLTATTTSATTTRAVRLLRPPVVLVHGVWSGPSAWTDGFVNYLRNHGFGLCDGCLADYSATPAGSFDPLSPESRDILESVHRARNEALGSVRGMGNGIAATQIDIIAHSMGGLVSRAVVASTFLPYRDRMNYGQGFIHKMITIGTPHRGTPIADFLLTHRCDMVDTGIFLETDTVELRLERAFSAAGRSLGPAIFGFQLASQPISHLGVTPVPSHAIACAAPSATGTESFLDSLTRQFGTTVDSILGGDGAHDTIVPGVSQRGGMTAGEFTDLGGIVHAAMSGADQSETSAVPVWDAAIGLLRAPLSSGSFGNFPRYEPVGSELTPEPPCPIPVRLQGAALPTINVFPASGAVLYSRETVDVAVSPPAGTYDHAYLSIGDDWVSLAGPFPAHYLYRVGSRAGELKLSATATGPGGAQAVGSATYQVAPSRPVTGIRVTPVSTLKLTRLGQKVPLRVLARMNDGSEVDVTRATARTTYQIVSGTNNVVAVSVDGLVEAKGIGSETLIIWYGGYAAVVSVTSTQPNHAPVLAVAPSLSVIAGQNLTSQVSATDQDGDALTFALVDAPSFVTLASTASPNQPLLVVSPLATPGTYRFFVTVRDNHPPSLGDSRDMTLVVSQFGRGDVNGSGDVSAPDVFYLVNYLFGGGAAPIGPGDASGDGQTNVADVFFLVNYLFAGGSPPI